MMNNLKHAAPMELCKARLFVILSATDVSLLWSCIKPIIYDCFYTMPILWSFVKPNYLLLLLIYRSYGAQQINHE